MAVGGKFSLAVLFLSVLVLFAGLALAAKDPELKQCKHQCKHQRRYDEDQKKECVDRCQKYYEEKEKQEREAEGRGGARRRHDDDDWVDLGRDHHGKGEEIEGDPYVFEEHHFTSVVRSEHGRIDVLQKFNKDSEFLRGIENYRVAFLEADPQTFGSPTHWDADAVLFVARGRGTITKIREEKRESLNIERGDVLRIRAGTPVYIINRDENEKLFVVGFFRPVNIPGELEAFSAAGGKNQESFYTAFSWELLEAALKTDRRRLERLLDHNQDMFTKASKEQIQAMSHREEGAGIWPLGRESSRPFSLLHERPVQSNNYGKLFEVDSRYYEQQLEDLDISVSFANITRGSMIGPYFNSKATKVAIVVDGEGYVEIACPHVSDSEDRGPTYQKVSSRLRHGSVFVVPAGHPVASVASRNKNLEVLCFEVNAKDNIRHPLAGKNNILSKLERQAKELAFGVREREVDQVFGNQNEQWFFPGPRERQWEGHADA